MIYMQVEEKIFKGKTWKSLVKRMWETSFDEAIDKAKFMFNVKKRIEELYHETITSEDYQKFIEELDKLNLIKLIRCQDCEHYVTSPRRCMAGKDYVNPKIVECDTMNNKEIEIVEGR